MPDRHKTTPKAVRMPDGLLARVEAAVARSAETVNGFIVAAIEEKLERTESGSTAPAPKPRSGSTTRKPRADTAPPVVLREPKGGKCQHRLPVGAYCRECGKIKA